MAIPSRSIIYPPTLKSKVTSQGVRSGDERIYVANVRYGYTLKEIRRLAKIGTNDVEREAPESSVVL